ncbi:hypothetical protein PFICI_08703 [Pestalotiopsis fici W106-1]|uniref:Uncharacterized protein n=1 Tax=Pestalotiopsis fici (strain W106-1 / CGMCC3.15140) TaxID=1229662 RepID=W3WYC8_PESFW|nr:uncharacterized protein PFICI_08703 [Pestalotiopsis fici W106-1]ETS78850.1 hypothetical protein PFICI_08703 [Pestalotiopsis fici W106-1]
MATEGDDDHDRMQASTGSPGTPQRRQDFLSVRTLYLPTSLILLMGFLLYLAIQTFPASSWPRDGVRNGIDYNNAETAVMIAPCGNTPDMARAADCKFDTVSFAWLPERCYDAELSEEFAQIKQWEYFEDQNRSVKVPHEKALTGDYSALYKEFEYHLRHGVFMWKKMHRALLREGVGRRGIDSSIANRAVAMDLVNSVIVLKFPDCGMA